MPAINSLMRVISRAVSFGLLLVPIGAFGAVTGLTALPSSVQFTAPSTGATVKTNSASVVIATGSGSANITVSTQVAKPVAGTWLSAFLGNTTIAAGSAVAVTISVNAAGLGVGSYTGQVIVTTGTVSATFNVILNVYGGQDIQLSPQSQLFSVTPGGQSVSFGVGFTSNGQTGPNTPGKPPFSYPVVLQPSTVDGANWLSATQTSNYTFSVTVSPGGLAAGTYSGGVFLTNGANNGPFMANFAVTVVVGSGGSQQSGADQSSLSFGLSAGGAASQQTLNVTSGGSPSYFTANPTTNSGGNWLQVNPANGSTPGAVTVTASPGSLAPGSYMGNIAIALGTQSINVPVTMTLTATAALQTNATAVALTAQSGGSCAPQTVGISSSDPTVPLPFTVKTPVISPTFGAWLTATPSSGNAPATITVSCNTAGLAPGSYTGTLVVASVDATNPGGQVSVPVTLMYFSGTQSSGSTQTISHIADGGGWKSTTILVNTDSSPATYTVNFWNEVGAALSPPLALGSRTGSIAVGGSATLRTADSDPVNLSEGWAEVVSSQSIGGTAIFRLDTAGQEAAVPLLTASGAKLEIPYETGNGLALGVALANPSTTTDVNITETVRDETGNQLSTRTFKLAAHNHSAFNPSAVAGVNGRGVVEYDATGNIYALGIRAAGGAFTSLDAVLPQTASTKTISHIADGGGWRSTIILVNTDTVPAVYTVNFWNEAGAAYTPPLSLGLKSGSIPVGGSVTIRTADLDPVNVTEGWAEIVSSQSIGGAAIFRLDTAGQEAAVPLLTSGGMKLEIPYEVGNGLALGVALANPSSAQDATVTETIRDENGNQLSTRIITLKAHNHAAFNPPGLNAISGRGVVEYDSNVNVYALGIRAAGGAFTSLRAVYKQ